MQNERKPGGENVAAIGEVFAAAGWLCWLALGIGGASSAPPPPEARVSGHGLRI
jgi:hypothetical protein